MENKNAYSEVLEILKLVDDEKRLEALPIEMLQVLKSKANPEYKPKISKDIPLDKQNLQPETLSILSWITMKYWSDEINEEEISNSDQKTEIEEQEENLAENLKTDNEIQKESEQIKDTEEIDEIDKKEDTTDDNSSMLVTYKDLKWYQKIKFKIVEFFNKILKRN